MSKVESFDATSAPYLEELEKLRKQARYEGKQFWKHPLTNEYLPCSLQLIPADGVKALIVKAAGTKKTEKKAPFPNDLLSDERGSFILSNVLQLAKEAGWENSIENLDSWLEENVPKWFDINQLGMLAR